MIVRIILIGLLLLGPLPALTEVPGSINPAVTQDNIDRTICVKGWAATVRPPANSNARGSANGGSKRCLIAPVKFQ